MMKTVKVPVSPGELIDKITILEIKSKKIKDKAKLKPVKAELALLNKTLSPLLSSNRKILPDVKKLKIKLFAINIRLWNIENVIRSLESKKDFKKKFIEKARSVYITNDMRSEAKRKINELFGSHIKEVKEYAKY